MGEPAGTEARRLASATRAVLARSWASPVAMVVCAVVLARLAWDAGGYFPDSYTLAGAIAFLALAILIVVRLPTWRMSTHALLGLAALAALAAWTGVSSGWSPTPADAVSDMQRDLLYVALFGLGLLAAGSGRYARGIPWLVLAVLLAVVGAGVLSRLAPDLVHGDPEVAGLTQGRLAWPLSYWNAFGAMAAIAAVLACGLASDVRTRVPLRAVGAGASVLAFVGMYLSLSRGAWLALIVGVVVLLAMGARRGSLVTTLVLVGAGSALAVLRLHGYPELVGAAAARPHPAAGHAYLAQFAAIVGVVVAVQAVLAAGRASPRLMAALGTVGRPLAMGAGAIVVVAALVVYAAFAGGIEGRSAKGLTDANGFVGRQWQDFLAPTRKVASGSARLTTAKGTRSDLYRVAFDGFEAHPLIGDGAGGFHVRWARDRRVDEDVRNAHSLELETLGELGAIGGLLLLGFLGSVIAAAVRSRLRPGGLGRGQSAAVAAGVAVWIAHSIVDWDWQVPALTGSAILLAAALFPYGRVRRRRSLRAPENAGETLLDWYRERARLEAVTGGTQ